MKSFAANMTNLLLQYYLIDDQVIKHCTGYIYMHITTKTLFIENISYVIHVEQEMDDIMNSCLIFCIVNILSMQE